MSGYDYIPIEHHGMSEWTFLVFVFIALAVTILIKLLIMWKDAHDAHMTEQVKRIDAHEHQLSNVAVDLAEIKLDGKHVRQSLEQMKEPLDDMRYITKRAIDKVLEKKE